MPRKPYNVCLMGFPTLRGTHVNPTGDVLFRLAALLRAHKSIEVLSKTWNLSTTGLKSLEGCLWKMNSGFGTNCSCIVRLVLGHSMLYPVATHGPQ